MRFFKNFSILLLPLIAGACSFTGASPLGGSDNDIKETKAFAACWSYMKETDIKSEVESVNNDNSKTFAFSEEEELYQEALIVHFDKFIQCYFGPTQYPSDDTDRKEIRLLRHHIIVASLAEYGAYKASGKIGSLELLKDPDYSGIQSDAWNSLGSVAQTNMMIRNRATQAPHHDPAEVARIQNEITRNQYRPNVLSTYEQYLYADRIFNTFDMVKELSTPARKRAKRGLKRFISLFSGVNGENLRSVLGDLKNFAINAQAMRDFYKASHRDIYTYMTCISQKVDSGSNETVVNSPFAAIAQDNIAAAVGSNDLCAANITKSWMYWDAILQRACNELEDVADLNHKKTCIPKFDMKTVNDAGMGQYYQ